MFFLITYHFWKVKSSQVQINTPHPSLLWSRGSSVFPSLLPFLDEIQKFTEIRVKCHFARMWRMSGNSCHCWRHLQLSWQFIHLLSKQSFSAFSRARRAREGHFNDWKLKRIQMLYVSFIMLLNTRVFHNFWTNPYMSFSLFLLKSHLQTRLQPHPRDL